MWDKVFKNGPSEICGRQPLKNIFCLSRPYHFKFFKGRLPQISLGPLLNTFSEMKQNQIIITKNSIYELPQELPTI